MRIIGTWSSPFTRKVRIVALERGIPIDFVVDSPLSDDTQVPEVNPLIKVPVLIRDDDSALVDSSLIATFLNELGKGPNLIQGRPLDRTVVLQWEAIADGVMDAAVLMRMESLRPESQRSDMWIGRQRAKVDGGMAWLDCQLATNEYCVGRRFSLADIAVGCCMAYLDFRFQNDEWHDRFLNVGRLSEKLEQLSSFQVTGFRS